MAKNTGNGYRIGSVCDRTQCHNSTNDTWIKRDAETGKFMDVKKDGPFKGVAKEDDRRRG
jgi:transposase